MTDESIASAFSARNLLGGETSPYLVQHKDNPVHWRPWGEVALVEAQATGKPILLSVGYAACHWCHVMAHESFENEAIAGVMNDLFVNIKVDREERPDIDQIYMGALHALGEQGGWPLTMFLTSAGEPVWGGTYFPPVARYGRPGFAEVLRSVASVFRDDPNRVDQNRAALLAHLAKAPERGSEGIGRADLDRIAARLGDFVDPALGGTRGAPKFPSASFLELLWRGSSRMGDERLSRLVHRTLDRICSGGIHDHIGGGFARYAVDERWLVPHFEKMLYDNAQLLELLALAHGDTGETLFAEAAEGIVAWLTRQMMAGDGRAFAASLDADSEGHEGRFYVWTLDEITAALDPDDAALFCRVYDITSDGNWESVSIPNRLDGLDPSPEESPRLAGIRERLRVIRDRRVPPGRDDKVLADWNGLMIAALARAGRHFGRADWVDLAEAAFRFVVESMSDGSRLGHSWREGRLLLPGLASDYGAMMRAALALAEGTGKRSYVGHASRWAEVLETYHADPETGGVFLTASDATALIVRPRSTLDDAMPNPNALIAESLLRLAVVTGEDRWRRRADEILTGLAPTIAANPFGHAALLNALDLRLCGAEIVVVGEEETAKPLADAATTLSFPTRIVLSVGTPEALPAQHPVRAAPSHGGSALAFVCLGERCSLPVHDVVALVETYRTMRAT